MACLRLGALVLALRSVAGFKDTSPFFLFSTSQLLPGLQHTHLTSSSSLQSALSDTLQQCPSDTYIVVSQPEVSATDYSARLAAPHLRQSLNRTDGHIHSTLVIPEVAGKLDAQALSNILEDKCKADILKADAATGMIPNEGIYPRIVKVDFSPLPASPGERNSKLADHDSFLHAVVTSLGGDKYTVLYITSPPMEGQTPPSRYSSPPIYHMEDQYILHSDLKRDLGSYAKNGSHKADLALFDTYQFLSPGIFMGLMVFLLLFVILYVGISAVSSLQVSYFAFSKEMGPTGQKK